MQWSEVIANPFLQNPPFKIESNQCEKIEMSPASNEHGLLQGEIYKELSKKRGGRGIVECSVQTTSGVRVADVALLSNAKFAKFGGETPYPSALDICVEIMPPPATARRKCT